MKQSRRLRWLTSSVAFCVSWTVMTGAFAQVVIPDMGDINCDGQANVVDVQLSIQVALGLPLSIALDGNQDGQVDGCETYSSNISGDLSLIHI